EHLLERRMDARVRIALGQQPAERAEMGHAIDRVCGTEEGGGRQLEPFHRVAAEMLVKARPPGGSDPIAGLQDRTHARARPAPHQTEMAAVLARHQLEDGARLPVPPHAQHDAFITPLHRRYPSSLYSFGNSSPISR